MEQIKTVLPEFLAGGGEMGELIRSYDWSGTSLGPVENWPQSLKTCVRIILTSSQPMFVWWGKDLINLYNDPYRAIVGGKHPQVLGAPAREVWKEIWEDAAGPRARIVMEENRGTYDEALELIMERNGYPEETYYTFSYSPVPGDNGGTSGIICANTDDTQRIIGERQLRTLKDMGKNTPEEKSDEELYERTISILKSNPQDFPFACIYTIADGMAIMSGSTEALPPAVLPARVALDSVPAREWGFAEAMANGNPVTIKGLREKYTPLPAGYWKLSPDQALILPIMQGGQDHCLAFLVVGLSPHRQLDERYFSFFQLVADQLSGSLANVHAYKEERKRSEALLEIDRAKTAFFSNISHEFRTPLTLMLGPVEELLSQADGQLNAQQIANLEATHRNALRLLRLVNTLLDFSRIEADKIQARYFPVNLTDITIDLASSFRAAVEHAGMSFHVEAQRLNKVAYVDRDMWEKIVLNLLSNAFKYTLKGDITVRLRQEEDTAVLEVQDTGVGIPSDELPFMFERFHRVKQSKGRTYEGTGIGLSLVKELVQLHKGNITVASKEGVGSTFTVKIPLGKDHLPEEQIAPRDDGDFTSSLSAAYVTEAISLVKDNNNTAGPEDHDLGEDISRILIVDDNADMRDYLQRLLEKRYVTDTATNGREALEKIALYPPELIISDVMMPEMDGIELLNAVKHHPATAATPVILLSARAGEEAKIEGYDIGADDYLVKPFSARELLARVRAQIRITRLHQHAVAILQHSAEELESKVEERTAALLRKNTELEQFAYIASHDLQEPLRKIRTFSELLQKSIQQGTPVNNYFDKIQTSAERMAMLIHDVLDYSRLTNTAEQLVEVDLNRTLRHVKTDFELLIEQKQAKIIHEQLPIVRGIPLQMQQLFTNLIGNSLKFSEHPPVIQITSVALTQEELAMYPEVQAQGNYVKLTFSDNGIGFEQQFAEKIFTIFQRLNEKKAYAGTGIGLALCKKIVENHHGAISAEGKLNEGATFTVILPTI